MSLADDAVKGLVCSVCFTPFKRAHGYPVLCVDCWNATPEEEREEMGVQQAFEREAY